MQAVKSTRKKKLYTQNSVLSETPASSPPLVSTPLPKTVKKSKTKIFKKGSLIIATTIKENVYPNTTSVSKKAPNSKGRPFKKPLSVQNSQQRPRIVKSFGNPRRSSADFVQPSKKNNNNTSTLALPMFKEFVMTSCDRDDVNLAKELTKTLPGKAKTALKISESTTHVICGEPRRTLTMLKAILLGCWIVSKTWLLASLEEKCWVDEEPYELGMFSNMLLISTVFVVVSMQKFMTKNITIIKYLKDFRDFIISFLVTFSGAVKARRMDREADMMTKSKLLNDVGTIYMGRLCKVPRNELLELIHMAGGSTVNQIRLADVILGHDIIHNDTDAVQVTEKWLLDSIQQHCPLPFTDYNCK